MADLPKQLEHEWDSEDAAVLRDFLTSRAGRRLFPKLSESIPLLLSGGQTNDILIRAGEVRGCSTLVNEIFMLAHPGRKVDVTASEAGYPAPEDDQAWKDGQSLDIK